MAAANGDVFHQVQRQRGFSLRRPCSQNQQLRRLQAGSELVQLRVAGRNASDALAFLKDSLEALEIVANDVLDRDQPNAYAIFGYRKNRRLRTVENRVRAVLSFKRTLLDVMRRANQVAQNGFFFDDARVVLDVRDARHAIGQRSEIRRAAGGFQLAFAMQFVGQGHQVDGLLAFAELDHVREKDRKS